jgi:hypothetical protein
MVVWFKNIKKSRGSGFRWLHFLGLLSQTRLGESFFNFLGFFDDGNHGKRMNCWADYSS